MATIAPPTTTPATAQLLAELNARLAAALAEIATLKAPKPPPPQRTLAELTDAAKVFGVDLKAATHRIYISPEGKSFVERPKGAEGKKCEMKVLPGYRTGSAGLAGYSGRFAIGDAEYIVDIRATELGTKPAKK